MHKFDIKKTLFRSVFSLVLLVMLRVSAYAAHTQPIVLDDTNSEYLLGRQLEILRDASGKLTIEDVASAAISPRFASVHTLRPNLGYTNDSIWFRFSLQNTTDKSDWIIDTGRSWMEQVTLYQKTAERTWQGLNAGTSVPLYQRPIYHERPVLPISLDSNETADYYLLIQSKKSPITLLGSIVHQDRFVHSDTLRRLSYGGFYAILLVMALYNTLLFISLKERQFLLLAALLFIYAVAESGFHGQMVHILLPSDPMVSQHIAIIALALILVVVARFAQVMLETRDNSPRLNKVFTIIGVSGLIVTIMALFFKAHQAVFWICVFSALIAFIAGVKRWVDGSRSAIFYTVALSAWLIPASFQIGAILGILPLMPATEHGAHFGAVAMSILFSLGVADQVHRVNLASQHFVPKPFLRHLGYSSIAEVRHGDSIEDVMTVMFCDIRDFSTRSEQMSPSENFAFLNNYLSQVSPAIRANGGFIDKYIGDAVMALFPDPPDRAVTAALQIQQAVSRFNADLLGGKTPLAVGIGLHRGRLMLGTIGDSERMEATVIADVVNVTSRLENLTKSMGVPIIMSSEVVDALSNHDNFILQKLGSTQIKGRIHTIEIFTVEQKR